MKLHSPLLCTLICLKVCGESAREVEACRWAILLGWHFFSPKVQGYYSAPWSYRLPALRMGRALSDGVPISIRSSLYFAADAPATPRGPARAAAQPHLRSPRRCG